MAAYYNEIEPYAAQWLRNLIAADLIAPGDVDERSIVDVQPSDLAGYTQVHFFAGLGGWSAALRLADWPDDEPVWTGSCPCQPFSVAGAQKGFGDKRHLWPEFRRLIEKRSPTVVFGEQVANAVDWLGGVRGDLEALGYAVGCIPMEAASATADHYRDRFWFVADYDFKCAGQGGLQRGGEFGGPSSDPQNYDGPVSDSNDAQQRSDGPGGNILERAPAGWIESASDLAERPPISVEHAARFGWGEGWTEHEFRSRGFTAAVASLGGGQFVECPDGKWRRLPPPGVRWLGTRVPARVAKLRAIGNAIDMRPAAEFIAAYQSIRGHALSSNDGGTAS
jgi:DNA (cytosine-5)-methyltransferase 1